MSMGEGLKMFNLQFEPPWYTADGTVAADAAATQQQTVSILVAGNGTNASNSTNATLVQRRGASVSSSSSPRRLLSLAAKSSSLSTFEGTLFYSVLGMGAVAMLHLLVMRGIELGTGVETNLLPAEIRFPSWELTSTNALWNPLAVSSTMALWTHLADWDLDGDTRQVLAMVVLCVLAVQLPYLTWKLWWLWIGVHGERPYVIFTHTPMTVALAKRPPCSWQDIQDCDETKSWLGEWLTWVACLPFKLNFQGYWSDSPDSDEPGYLGVYGPLFQLFTPRNGCSFLYGWILLVQKLLVIWLIGSTTQSLLEGGGSTVPDTRGGQLISLATVHALQALFLAVQRPFNERSENVIQFVVATCQGLFFLIQYKSPEDAGSLNLVNLIGLAACMTGALKTQLFTLRTALIEYTAKARTGLTQCLEKTGIADKPLSDGWPYIVGSREEDSFPSRYLPLTLRGERREIELDAIDEAIRQAVTAGCSGKTWPNMPEVIGLLLVNVRRILIARGVDVDAKGMRNGMEMCLRDLSFQGLLRGRIQLVEEELTRQMVDALEVYIPKQGLTGVDLARQRRVEIRKVVEAKVRMIYFRMNHLFGEEAGGEAAAETGGGGGGGETNFPMKGVGDVRKWALATTSIRTKFQSCFLPALMEELQGIDTVHAAEIFLARSGGERMRRREEARAIAHGRQEKELDSRIRMALGAVGAMIPTLTRTGSDIAKKSCSSRVSGEDMLVNEQEEDGTGLEFRAGDTLDDLTCQYQARRLDRIRHEREIKARAAVSDVVVRYAFGELESMVSEAFGRFFEAVLDEVSMSMSGGHVHDVYVVQVGSSKAQEIYDRHRRGGVATVASLESSFAPPQPAARGARGGEDHLATLMSQQVAMMRQRDWEFDHAEGDDLDDADWEDEADRARGGASSLSPGLIPEISRVNSDMSIRRGVPMISRTRSESPRPAGRTLDTSNQQGLSHAVYRNAHEGRRYFPSLEVSTTSIELEARNQVEFRRQASRKAGGLSPI